MTPTDAQTFWISEKIPNDQLLLYCFDGQSQHMDELRRSVVERASLIPDLNVRIRESPWHLDYPVWEPMPVDASLVRVHELPENSWLSCIHGIEKLLENHVDPRESPVDAAPVSRRHRRAALQWPGADRSSAGRSFSGGRQTRVGDCSPAVLAATAREAEDGRAA